METDVNHRIRRTQGAARGGENDRKAHRTDRRRLGNLHVAMHSGEVSVHRAPHLLRYRALEVRPVRLRARSLASAAPCKRLLGKGLAHMGRFTPENDYTAEESIPKTA